ncbi:MAG TPA: GNAT family N-acetyltransferase [Longimicrobiaceae bacterium]|jgi:N-acetylglutamate synthase-like GNAT family acetyltransferase|nr:GNAT family N-acetyltransferase [Longimicrobiaceae bacterium]
MRDKTMEWRRGELTVSTDRRRLELDAVLEMLLATHWGGGMRRDLLERAVENSVCFGVYRGARLVGFARAVSDLATYGYLTDVVITESERGRGLGRWLVECILAHPDLQNLRRFSLMTRDAAGLYEQFGFGPQRGTSTYMEIWNPAAYGASAG